MCGQLVLEFSRSGFNDCQAAGYHSSFVQQNLKVWGQVLLCAIVIDLRLFMCTECRVIGVQLAFYLFSESSLPVEVYYNRLMQLVSIEIFTI